MVGLETDYQQIIYIQWTVYRKGWKEMKLRKRSGNSSLCMFAHRVFNFIVKEALKCLKQVCDTVGQKDLFGNNLIGAEGVS